MNEQLRQRAQEIADEHGNDAYSVALAMLEHEDKIKAEAVREAIAHSVMNDNHKRNSYWAYDVMAKYANKLENQND